MKKFKAISEQSDLTALEGQVVDIMTGGCGVPELRNPLGWEDCPICGHPLNPSKRVKEIACDIVSMFLGIIKRQQEKL